MVMYLSRRLAYIYILNYVQGCRFKWRSDGTSRRLETWLEAWLETWLEAGHGVGLETRLETWWREVDGIYSSHKVSHSPGCSVETFVLWISWELCVRPSLCLLNNKFQYWVPNVGLQYISMLHTQFLAVRHYTSFILISASSFSTQNVNHFSSHFWDTQKFTIISVR